MMIATTVFQHVVTSGVYLGIAIVCPSWSHPVRRDDDTCMCRMMKTMVAMACM